ncbi:MAG: biotin/lipoyl-binding protein, partial [Pseudomonadota bacterium]
MKQEKDEQVLHIDIPKAPLSRKVITFGLIVVILFFGGFAAWALLAPLESAAVTEGKVKVAGERRLIQHLEGGIVQAIFVKDGSEVKKGALLIKLDDVQAKVALAVRRNEVRELMAVEARLIAERDQQVQINFPKRLLDNKDDPKLNQIMRSQESIFTAKKEYM